jgi:multidrug efflux pump subunit AcrB
LIARSGTKNVAHNWGLQTKKLAVNIHPAQAQIAGITNQDIAISLQTMLGGAQTGTFREEEKSIPIIMRNHRSARLDIEALEGLNIYAQQSGKSVPLKQVADVNVVWQASKILRRDLTRTITVTSDVQTGFTASEIMNGLKPWLKKAAARWPEGYFYELGGDAEGSADAMGAVTAKLPLSVFIILLLLIGQFNSLRKPAIILATIPMGLIGVILGLLLTGSYFGFMAFLGVISLAGIVINNGIVLLDRIEIELRDFGKSAQDAIVDAALGRLRPILLTTATTSVGLVPLWLGGGLLWEPMAIGIIFGLLFATLLTLVFVPVLYRLFFRVSFQT